MQQKFRRQNDIRVKVFNKVVSFFFHEKKIKEPIKLKSVKRVLIVDYSLIGDAIMSIPMFRIIHNNCPEAKIDIVCSDTERILIQGEGLINKFYIVSFDKILSMNHPISTFKYIKRVSEEINKNGQYDFAIEPRGDIRLLLFMSRCKSKRKISYNYSGGECFLTDVIDTGNSVGHLLDEKINTLRFIGCEFDDDERVPRLTKPDECKTFESKFRKKNCLDNKFIIGIHPGSSQNIKKWEHYDELIYQLNLEIHGCCFVLFGGPGENDADILYTFAYEKGINSVVSKTKLQQYVYTLGLCNCVICNDSGAGHIAAALGVKTVVLLGPYDPEYCAPIGNNVYPLSKRVWCKPCLSRECKFNSKECLELISVREVVETVKSACEL